MTTRRWMTGAGALLAAAGFVLSGCTGDDSDWPDMGQVPDHGTDDAGVDVPVDVPADTPVDPGGDGPVCSAYPAGPYGWEAEGDTAPRMSWPSAIAGADELSTAADVEQIRCDPDVHSIFVQVTTTTCPNCPARVQEIGRLKSHWEATGARWIFVVADATTARVASDYVQSKGVTFGWRTNDSDNTAGEGTIAYSSIYGGVPWTGVIRTSDMQIVYEEPDTSFLDIEAIATELAGE